jgi:hypothetical protein
VEVVDTVRRLKKNSSTGQKVNATGVPLLIAKSSAIDQQRDRSPT